LWCAVLGQRNVSGAALIAQNDHVAVACARFYDGDEMIRPEWHRFGISLKTPDLVEHCDLQLEIWELALQAEPTITPMIMTMLRRIDWLRSGGLLPVSSSSPPSSTRA
jgi:hypothetical protein